MIMWATVGAFLVSLLCAIQSMTGGDAVYKGVAAAGLVLGVMGVVAFWAAGLAPQVDAEESSAESEWAKAIK